MSPDIRPPARELVEPILESLADPAEARPTATLARSVERMAEAIPGLEPSDRDGCQEALRTAYREQARDDHGWQASVLVSGYLLSLARDPRSWHSVNRQPSGLPTYEFISSIDASVADIARFDSPIVELWRGVREHVNGNDPAAMSLFHAAGSHPDFPWLVKDSLRGATTCRPLPSHTQLLSSRGGPVLEPIEWLYGSPPSGRTGPTIVLTGDDVYWRAFGPSIIASISRTRPDRQVGLHFHVVNPAEALTPDTLAALAGLSEAANVRLSVTSETTPDARRSYFAAARYFRAPDLLDQLGQDIVMLDMDIEFTSSPRRFLDQFPTDSVTQLVSTGPYWGFLPWRTYWAGLLYLPANDPGRLFAQMLAKACGYLWADREALRWWTDQTALFVAQRAAHLGGLGPSVNLVSKVPEGLRSSEKLKIDGLRQLEEIREAMDRGEGWHAALEDAQQ